MRTRISGVCGIVGSSLVMLCALGGCATDQSGSDEHPAPGALAYDKSVFHDLLEGHAKIQRTVKELDGGVETVTESDDPRISGLLADHVLAMKKRMENGQRVRQWDPIFVAMFDARESVHLEVTPTPKGVRVRETSDDPRVAKLIKAHGGVVSAFVRNGFDEAGEAHPIPADAAKP